jgi:hypothetical protein
VDGLVAAHGEPDHSSTVPVTFGWVFFTTLDCSLTGRNARMTS